MTTLTLNIAHCLKAGQNYGRTIQTLDASADLSGRGHKTSVPGIHVPLGSFE